MPMPIIAVVGSRQSGKTTAVEAIARGLTAKGYRVASAKHIPEAEFTIDTKRKDTWRHAQAGAKIIMSVAPNELTIIKKVDTTQYDVNAFVQQFEREVDILILEGFRELVAEDLSVPKVVTIKTSKEIPEALKYFKPVVAFEGSDIIEAPDLKIPKIDVLKEPERLVDIIEKRVSPVIRKRRELRQSLAVRLNKEALALNPFVQGFVRNVILAMISTLKDTGIKGDEDVSIIINSANK
jgi:molybdopterin-guanine dinucleotide biosynthesis protein MobB